ncbi:hypothetical protein [Candidatus Poriferisocius sp.]|uniref:hypothetical protein n=1 Tax=Candidatus Poriferisocius sp. TaxID=3101276 RepID=UPI003B02292D
MTTTDPWANRLATHLWAKHNPDSNPDDCPGWIIPTEDDLAKMLNDPPPPQTLDSETTIAEHLAEANTRLNTLISPPEGWAYTWTPGPPIIGTKTGGEIIGPLWAAPAWHGDGLPTNPDRLPVLSTAETHRRWDTTDRQHRPKHPLAPIIHTWQTHWATSPPETPTLRHDRRPMMPHIGRAAEIVTAPRTETDRIPLTEIPAEVGDQLALPGLGRGGEVPAPMLAVFDAAGMLSYTQGKGAPRPLRLWVATLIHTPADRIAAGGPVILTWPTADIVRYLTPPDAAPPNLSKYWRAIADAIWTMGRIVVPVPGGGWAPITVRRGPLNRDDLRHGTTTLEVRLPPGSEHGPRINWPRLQVHGITSAPMYRGHIIARYIIDRTAYRGAGITRAHIENGHRTRRRRDLLARVERQTWSAAELARMLALADTTRTNRSRAINTFTALADEDDPVLDLWEIKPGRWIILEAPNA